MHPRRKFPAAFSVRRIIGDDWGSTSHSVWLRERASLEIDYAAYGQPDAIVGLATDCNSHSSHTNFRTSPRRDHIPRPIRQVRPQPHVVQVVPVAHRGVSVDHRADRLASVP